MRTLPSPPAGPATPPPSTSNRPQPGAIALRGELSWATGAAALVAAAFIITALRPSWLTPVDTDSAGVFHDFGSGAPLFAWFQPHASWGTSMAVVMAAAVVAGGPRIAATVSWRWLPWIAWLTSVGWIVSLAMIDGWTRGITGRLTSRDEYLHEIPRVNAAGGLHPFLSHFVDGIVDGHAQSWTTQTSGHPPGAVLTFVALDRVGLGGGSWAAFACIAIGASASAAILLTVGTLTDPSTARRCAPFVALSPAAVWIGVSADGLFAGVAAWGLTWAALAATAPGRRRHGYALAAGVTLGFCLYLSYGLVLLIIPLAAILIVAGTTGPLMMLAIGALVVIDAFTVGGFWWLDGYHLVKVRYWQGIAAQRPFAYWGWANWAAVVCAVGLAVPASFSRALSFARIRARDPVTCLVVAMLTTLLVADLSRLSKAETERIWLPFTVWLMIATTALPYRTRRFWLVTQAVTAVAINTVLFTNW